MRRRQRGTIVNIASIAAANAPGMMTHYAATKAALARYSRDLRRSLRMRGSRSDGLSRPSEDTPWEDLVRDQLGGDLGMGDRLPSGRADELALKLSKPRGPSDVWFILALRISVMASTFGTASYR